MDQGSSVYDLGEIDPTPKPKVSKPQPRPRRRPSASGPHVTSADSFRDELEQLKARQRSPRKVGWRTSGSLALLVPGAGHLVQGEIALGLFFITALGFCATATWALLESLWRLVPTLAVFEMPASRAFWILGWLYLSACMLYVANVLSATTHTTRHAGRPASPVLSGLASAVIPGWGQLLNGDRLRAVVFLTGTLALAAVGLSISGGAMALLDGFGLYLPYWSVLEMAPTLRWTVPLLLWALAIYDAAQSAAARRSERRAEG